MLRTWLVFLALAGGTLAQEIAAPKQDEKARAAFEKMARAVYRARADGLREITFSFEVETIPTDRPATTFGPFRIHWKLDEGWQLLDENGQPDPKPERRLKPGFTDRVVGDLVGWEPQTMIRGRGLKISKEGLLEVSIPHEKPAEEVRVERIDLQLDSEGRLLRQTLVGTGGILLTRLLFFYETRGDRCLVAKVHQETGGPRLLKTRRYGDFGRYTLPVEIETLNADRRREIVRYRDFSSPKPPAETK